LGFDLLPGIGLAANHQRAQVQLQCAALAHGKWAHLPSGQQLSDPFFARTSLSSSFAYSVLANSFFSRWFCASAALSVDQQRNCHPARRAPRPIALPIACRVPDDMRTCVSACRHAQLLKLPAEKIPLRQPLGFGAGIPHRAPRIVRLHADFAPASVATPPSGGSMPPEAARFFEEFPLDPARMPVKTTQCPQLI
jgi:hypothetical protein